MQVVARLKVLSLWFPSKWKMFFEQQKNGEDKRPYHNDKNEWICCWAYNDTGGCVEGLQKVLV